MVALKSSVCRDCGQRRRIFSMSGRKPMSSIRSASSSTDHPQIAAAPGVRRAIRSSTRPGRAHHHVGAWSEAARSACRNRLAAVERHDARMSAGRKLDDLVADLHGQLAGGHQSQSPAGSPGLRCGCQLFEDRDGEGGRLARAGLGLGHQVHPPTPAG